MLPVPQSLSWPRTWGHHSRSSTGRASGRAASSQNGYSVISLLPDLHPRRQIRRQPDDGRAWLPGIPPAWTRARNVSAFGFVTVPTALRQWHSGWASERLEGCASNTGWRQSSLESEIQYESLGSAGDQHSLTMCLKIAWFLPAPENSARLVSITSNPRTVAWLPRDQLALRYIFLLPFVACLTSQ